MTEVEALRAVVALAEEARQEWDRDNDPRVGKILIALSGGLKGYRPDTDAIHAAMAAANKREAVEEMYAALEAAPIVSKFNRAEEFIDAYEMWAGTKRAALRKARGEAS